MQMWFFMLFIAIVLPFIMFMSSFYFIAGGPKNINNIFAKFSFFGIIILVYKM